VLLVAAVALIVLVGGAAGVVALFTAGGGSAYETPSGLYVQTSTDHGVGSGNPFTGTDTVAVGNVTFSASGDANVTVGRFTGTWTNVSSVDASTNAVTVNPDDKQSVTIGGGATNLSFGDITAASDGVDFVYGADTSADLTVQGLPASESVTAATASGTLLDTTTTDGAGEATFALPSASSTKVVVFQNDAPSVDNNSATPTGGLQSDSVTYEIDVSDPTFATLQGDELNASLYIDGSYRGSDTLTANGTASVSEGGLSGGSHDYYWVVNDSYGASVQSDTFDIQVPSNIAIYEETDPDDLVDGPDATITARFFRDDSNTVINKTTNDGTVSLQGLDPDREYVLVVRVDGYRDRRVILESLFEQKSVYVLNDSVAASDVVFELNDNTGEFPPETTRLFVEKPIVNTTTGDTTFQTIAGDTFGASGTFPATLETDRRYRLRVVNAEGQERVLGAYTVTGDAAEELPIGAVTFEGANESAPAFDATLEAAPNDTEVIRVKYRDPENATDTLTVGIQRENGTMLVNNTTYTGPFGTTQQTYYVPASAPDDADYRVVWRADRGSKGILEHDQVVSSVADLGGRFDIIEDRHLSLISYLTIIAVLGLVSIKSPKFAVLPATAVASALTALGFVAIPALFLGASGVIGLLAAASGGEY